MQRELLLLLTVGIVVGGNIDGAHTLYSGDHYADTGTIVISFIVISLFVVTCILVVVLKRRTGDSRRRLAGTRLSELDGVEIQMNPLENNDKPAVAMVES